MLYITGFKAHDPVVFLRTPRRAVLVVPDLEFGRARQQCHDGITVVTPRHLTVDGQPARKLDDWVLGVVRRCRVKHVTVSPDFPFGVANTLTAAGIEVRAAEGVLFPKRERKTARELKAIEASQQAAVIAMRAAVDMTATAKVSRNGELTHQGRVLTSEQVRRRIAVVLLERDCFCADTIVAGGQQATDPHHAGTGPLRAGQAIVIDIFPRHLAHGYCGDLTRTVAKGPVSDELAAMYRAVRAAQTAALKRVRPGVKAATVHRAAAAELERRGFRTETRDGQRVGFFHGTGHGIGLEVHEAPRVSTTDERLKSGHVITIEPGLYYPEIGGIRIEDTVAVTRDGWRFLCPCEKHFVI